MTRDEILKLRQIAFRRFYTRPKFLLHRLLQMRSWHDLQVNLQGLRSLYQLCATSSLFHDWKGKAGTHEIAERRAENYTAEI